MDTDYESEGRESSEKDEDENENNEAPLKPGRKTKASLVNVNSDGPDEESPKPSSSGIKRKTSAVISDSEDENEEEEAELPLKKPTRKRSLILNSDDENPKASTAIVDPKRLEIMANAESQKALLSNIFDDSEKPKRTLVVLSNSEDELILSGKARSATSKPNYYDDDDSDIDDDNHNSSTRRKRESRETPPSGRRLKKLRDVSQSAEDETVISPTRRSARIQKTSNLKMNQKEEIVSIFKKDLKGKLSLNDQDKADCDDNIAVDVDEFDWYEQGRDFFDDEQDALDDFIVSDGEEVAVDEGAEFDCVCGGKEEEVATFTGRKEIREDASASKILDSLRSRSEREILKLLAEFSSPIRTLRWANLRHRTALHIACEVDLPRIVEKLLELGADVLAVDLDGITPLHVAAAWSWASCEAIVNFVLSESIVFESETDRRLAPRTNSGRKRKIVDEDAEEEEDVTRKVTRLKNVLLKSDLKGRCSLSIAAYHAAPEAAELESSEAQPNSRPRRSKRKSGPPKSAEKAISDAKSSRFSIFQIASDVCDIQLSETVNREGENLVHLACRGGNFWVLRELERFVDFDEAIAAKTFLRRSMPIHFAAAGVFALRSSSSLECVKYLIEYFKSRGKVSSNVNVRDQTVVISEGYQGNRKRKHSVMDLVEDGDEEDEEGGFRTPLLYALGSGVPWGGSSVTVAGVVSEDDDEASEGSPYHDVKEEDRDYGMGSGSKVKVEEILEEEEETDEEKEEKIMLQVTKLLIDCGLSWCATDSHAADGLATVVRYLLNLGLAPDLKDKHGWTPLLYAHVAIEASGGQVKDDCVVALLERKPSQLHELVEWFPKSSISQHSSGNWNLAWWMHDDSDDEDEENLAGMTREDERIRRRVIGSLVTSLATKPMAFKLLNDLLRSNQRLLLDPQSPLIWVKSVKGLLDFDNRRRLFIHHVRTHVSSSAASSLRGGRWRGGWGSAGWSVKARRGMEVVSSFGEVMCGTTGLAWLDDEDIYGTGGGYYGAMLNATYDGEAGIGPGVTREFWTCFGEDMVKPIHGIFEEVGGESGGTLYFADDSASSKSSWWEPEYLRFFDMAFTDRETGENYGIGGKEASQLLCEHVGRMLGIAMVEGQLVPDANKMSPLIFLMLADPDGFGKKEELGKQNEKGIGRKRKTKQGRSGRRNFTLEHIEILDAEFHRNLIWMLENDVSKLGLSFSVDVRVESGEMETKELCKGGESIVVTEGNKKEFTELVVKERFERSTIKREAFLKGTFLTLLVAK
ncbi:E3 ubiquitin-protein ligase nedd4 [Phlyctochytrium planicorne]|nr:E3 ubiquitin-protein ligase nedd4 [Phlyctochytrium planicorne]